ncbi:MAG: hypothetical protein KKD69_07640 [Euryarchaeota archaeon]|nr:hypothetical protein [Euryarchaeota archaeon]
MGWISQIVWSPDGRMLASGSDDNTIRICDAETGKPLRTLEGHDDTVFSVAWSPDGRTLASGSDDETIILWDTKTLIMSMALRPLDIKVAIGFGFYVFMCVRANRLSFCH